MIARTTVRWAAIAGTLVLLTPLGALAQDLDRSRPPELGPPPELSLPEIQQTTLSNGLEISVVEMHEVPVVNLRLILDAGSERDPADLTGLATFVANMLDEGAGGRSALGIADEVAFLGARMNTFASHDGAGITLAVPRSQFAAALSLMADVALHPDFKEEEVTRQRDLRATQILQQQDRATTMAAIAYAGLVYGGEHPYGRPVNGTTESTAMLDRDRVIGFYDTFYKPNGAQVLVVGDVTLDEVREMIAVRFGAWTRGPLPQKPEIAPPEPGKRTFYLVDKPGAAQTVVRMGHLGVSQHTQDDAALQVMNTILGGSFTSRLNNNLRETKGYTYGARSGFTRRRMAGPFSAAASVVTAKTDSSLIEFFYELRRIRDDAVTSEELDKAKSYIALRLPARFETTGGTAGQYINLLQYGLPLDYHEQIIPQINAVTIEDVQRVAREYINPENFVVVLVGDRAKIEEGVAALGEGEIEIRDMWGHPVMED